MSSLWQSNHTSHFLITVPAGEAIRCIISSGREACPVHQYSVYSYGPAGKTAPVKSGDLEGHAIRPRLPIKCQVYHYENMVLL